MILSIVYPQFFGLNKLPFRLRPDAEFVYAGTEYARARSRLKGGLREAARVLLLLSNPGLGKTLLLDEAIQTLEAEADWTLCRIKQPRISSKEFLEAFVLQIGASTGGDENRAGSYAELLVRIDAIGAQKLKPLLIVDDAHLLPPTAATALSEILKRVSNIKIVLSGRPGMGLEEMAVRFLGGEQTRIIELAPLSQSETKAYIEHRLSIAGGGNRELISADAYAMIYQHTAGTPRLINALCDAALHSACLRASGQLSSAEVLLATQDARWAEAVARDRAGSSATAGQAGVREHSDASAVEPVIAQLVVSVGDKTLATWPLRPGRVSIGRAPDNEFRLDTRVVSRHHCQVTTVNSVSTVEDLESINGISVNGKVTKRHVLQHADQIQLGDHTLTYLLT
ncbi:MAG: FHA domain-containing protein [Pseudomonadota bacterium]|nr:FHA domain-containing protein [Pseudomonadota bacterium]